MKDGRRPGEKRVGMAREPEPKLAITTVVLSVSGAAERKTLQQSVQLEEDLLMSSLRAGSLLLLAGCLSMALRADQVTLKNGDRLTGAIIKKDGDKVTLRSEFFGEVAIPWSAVTSVKSDTALHVVLPGEKEVNGTIDTRNSIIRVTAPSAAETAPLAGVVTIRNDAEQRKHERLLAPGWLDLWAGHFDLGLALARGNARTNTFTTAFEAARVTRADEIKLHYNQIYATATVKGASEATAEAVRGGWLYDRKAGSRTFVNAFNDYEFDRFQNLDLRFALGGGFGVHAIKNDGTTLDLLAGVSYNREQFNTGLTRNSAEAYWGDDWAYKLSGRSSLTQSFRMFNNLTTPGRYRMNFDLGSSTVLRKWLSWQVAASDRFLSDPVPGRQRNDIVLTTGFRVNFAR